MKIIDIDFIYPGFIKNLPVIGIVKGGMVTCEINGSIHFLYFIDDFYPDETPVTIFIKNGFLFCESFQDQKIRVLKSELERLDKELQELEKANKRKAETKAFNDALNIPFSWNSEINHVLSGLTERSGGNGCYKSTVFHILLLEDYQEGKIKRSAGTFLCNRQNKFPELLEMEPKQQYKITCKACLKIAKRWSQK